jgi:hypothetical protein
MGNWLDSLGPSLKAPPKQSLSDQKLAQMMNGAQESDNGLFGVGAGEPLNINVIADDPDAEVGSFYEQFWDIERYDYENNLLGIYGADYQANPWDCVQLGEYRLPGLWAATATPAIKLDIQKPLGYDGAAIVTRGYLPAGITLTGTLWTPMQFRILQDIWPGIWIKPFKIHAQDVQAEKKGKVSAVEKDQGEIVGESRSLGIVNPALNMMGIFYVVVQKPTPLVACEIIGARRMTIECVEYVPEPSVKPSAVKKTKGSKGTERGPNAFDNKIYGIDAAYSALTFGTNALRPPSTKAAALEPGKVP